MGKGLARLENALSLAPACPNCRAELVHYQAHGRTVHRCPFGHGHALSPALVRGWLEPSRQEEFERALSQARPAGRPCPRCRCALLLSRFQGVPVEHCADCPLVWLAELSLERLPFRANRHQHSFRGPTLPVEVRADESFGLASPIEGVARTPGFPYLTAGLLALFAAITLLFLRSGGDELYVAFPRLPWRNGGLSLVLALFAHGSLTHLLSNGYFFLLAGFLLETRMGWDKFLALFLLCGLAGHAGAALVSGEGGIGASGAICGLLTALVAMEPRGFFVFRGGVLPGWPGVPGIFALSLRVPLWLWAFAWFAFDLYGMGEQLRGAGDQLGHGAHLGGAVAGALLGAAPFFHGRDAEGG